MPITSQPPSNSIAAAPSIKIRFISFLSDMMRLTRHSDSKIYNAVAGRAPRLLVQPSATGAVAAATKDLAADTAASTANSFCDFKLHRSGRIIVDEEFDSIIAGSPRTLGFRKSEDAMGIWRGCDGFRLVDFVIGRDVGHVFGDENSADFRLRRQVVTLPPRVNRRRRNVERRHRVAFWIFGDPDHQFFVTWTGVRLGIASDLRHFLQL